MINKFKKNTKINNNNTPPIKSPKDVFDEYTDMNKFRTVPINSEIIESIAQVFIQTAKEKDIITMEQIYQKFGMSNKEFIRLRDKYPSLNSAYEYALNIVGTKRFVYAAENRLNWGVINSTQAHYCKIAKEQTEWRSNLRNKEENRAQNISVYLEPIPNSDLVPVRKDGIK